MAGTPQDHTCGLRYEKWLRDEVFNSVVTSKGVFLGTHVAPSLDNDFLDRVDFTVSFKTLAAEMANWEAYEEVWSFAAAAGGGALEVSGEMTFPGPTEAEAIGHAKAWAAAQFKSGIKSWTAGPIAYPTPDLPGYFNVEGTAQVP